MLRRPAVVAVAIGTAVPVMAVQRVTLGLLAISILSFSFAVAIQIAVGLAVIVSARTRPMSIPRALDLWFAGHVPYSLWLLAAAGLFAAVPAASLDLLIGLAVIPAAWTGVIVAAYCRQVLGTGDAGARWRALAHAVAIWAVSFQLVAWSAGGWFQITRSVASLFT